TGPFMILPSVPGAIVARTRDSVPGRYRVFKSVVDFTVLPSLNAVAGPEKTASPPRLTAPVAPMRLSTVRLLIVSLVSFVMIVRSLNDDFVLSIVVTTDP